eukprot:gene16920-18626_t
MDIPKRRIFDGGYCKNCPDGLSTPNSYVNVPHLCCHSKSNGLNAMASSSDKEEPSQEDIVCVSERITTDWQILARNLFRDFPGVDPEGVIEEIEYQRPHKLQDVSAKLLSEWKKKLGCQATKEQLLNALCRTGRSDIYEHLTTGKDSPRQPQYMTDGDSLSSSYFSKFSGRVSPWANCQHYQRANSHAHAYSYEHVSWPDEEDTFHDVDLDSRSALPSSTLSEVEDLKKALLNPDISIVSLAGHISSGKTIILDVLYREINKDQMAFERSKVIKIQASDQQNQSWLAMKILEKITNEVHQPHKLVNQVINSLNGIVETDAYDEVLLILDLSLIPFSSNGKEIVKFLHEVMRQMSQKRKLKICISTLCSLWNTMLFTDKVKSREVIIRTMEEEEAVKFMVNINPALSKQVASNICRRIERVPFLLKAIAETDIKSVFAVDSKQELLKAIHCKLDELIDHVCSSFAGKKTLQAIFACLDSREKSLLAQVLTFSSEFDVKRAWHIVDSDMNITDRSFNSFCEHGALFFSSRKLDNAAQSKKVYTIPAMLGQLLRAIVQDHNDLRSRFEDAEKRHQELFHNLLLYMSKCFMADLPKKNEELRMLEPFTPSDGIPENLSISIEDKDERVRRIVSLFRRHAGDIKASLKVGNNIKYKAAVAVATNLRVHYLFSKLLSLHEALEIYRNLKRKARFMNSLDEDKLNVFIATFKVDAFGYHWFSSEAKSLLEASIDPLSGEVSRDGSSSEEGKEIYAYSLFKFGTCLLAKGIMSENEKRQELLKKGSQQLQSSSEFFKQKIQQQISYHAYIVDSNRILAGFKFEDNKQNEALDILQNTCLKTCAEHFGDQHPLTCNCKRLLGRIYRAQERYNEAKNILLEVFDAEQQFLGEHSDTAQTISELGLCCLEEFKAWQEELNQATLTAVPDPRPKHHNFHVVEISRQQGNATIVAEIHENDDRMPCHCGMVECRGHCLEEKTVHGGFAREYDERGRLKVAPKDAKEDAVGGSAVGGSALSDALRDAQGDGREYMAGGSLRDTRRKEDARGNARDDAVRNAMVDERRDAPRDAPQYEQGDGKDNGKEYVGGDAPQDEQEGARGSLPPALKSKCNCNVPCKGPCSILLASQRISLLRLDSSSTASLREGLDGRSRNSSNPATAPNYNYHNAWDGSSPCPTSDLLLEAESYLKKAARYFLHVVGRRDGACEALEHLAEVYGLRGDERQRQKWLQKAKEYRECITR